MTTSQSGLFDILEPISTFKPLLAARPYQETATLSVISDFSNFRRLLVVSATATGKTVMMAHIIKRFLKTHTGRILILAHRCELITQAQDKIESITGHRPAMEMSTAVADKYGTRSRIVVGSIQTQISGKENQKRMHRFNPMDFDLIIIDEAHRAVSVSYRTAIEYYLSGNPKALLLGFTATPDRNDRKAMSKAFERVSFVYPMQQAITDGWIVAPKTKTITVKSLDFSKVRTTAGDLNGADLERIMSFEKTLHEMSVPLLELAGMRQTLVFCVGVEHAKRFSEILNRHRPDCARCVHGKTPPEHRRELFKQFAKKEFQFLCNVGVVTEGTDLPGVEVIALGRPTESRALFEQMIGRGVRPAADIAEILNLMEGTEQRLELILKSSKPFCEIIDFAGNCGKHKLITVADILGGELSEKVKERATKIAKEKAEKTGMAQDIFEALKKAQEEIDDEVAKKKIADDLEASKRRHLKADVKYIIGEVDPFSFYDIKPPKPNKWRDATPPTQPQIEFLEQRGIDGTELSRGECGKLIGQLKGKLNIGQARVLSNMGYGQTEIQNLTPSEAGRLIDRTRKNGGRRIGSLIAHIDGLGAVAVPEF